MVSGSRDNPLPESASASVCVRERCPGTCCPRVKVGPLWLFIFLIKTLKCAIMPPCLSFLRSPFRTVLSSSHFFDTNFCFTVQKSKPYMALGKPWYSPVKCEPQYYMRKVKLSRLPDLTRLRSEITRPPELSRYQRQIQRRARYPHVNGCLNFSKK